MWIRHKYAYFPCLLSLPHSPSHPSRSSQSTELSTLGSTAASHQLSVIRKAVYIRQCHAPNLSHPLLPPPRTSPPRTSLVAQTVKRLSTMWETWVPSLGWEDSLEKEMATHSSTLALKNPMDRGAWCRLLSMGLQRVRHDWTTSLSFFLLPPLCLQVHSLCLCLYSCPANRFISIIFSDSICMC